MNKQVTFYLNTVSTGVGKWLQMLPSHLTPGESQGIKWGTHPNKQMTLYSNTVCPGVRRVNHRVLAEEHTQTNEQVTLYLKKHSTHSCGEMAAHATFSPNNEWTSGYKISNATKQTKKTNCFAVWPVAYIREVLQMSVYVCKELCGCVATFTHSVILQPLLPHFHHAVALVQTLQQSISK